MRHALTSPRHWLGLVAGAALAFGGATAFAESTQSQPGARGTTPQTTTGQSARAPADAGTHTSLKELQEAQVQTGNVAEAKDMEEARQHLQRAANCLVGRDSPDFKATADDPCANLGRGAIPDSTDPQRASLARQALSQIKSGMQAQDLASAQRSAKEATDTLRTAVTGPLIDKE